MKKNYLIELCAKEITGNISKAEKEFLDVWVADSEEHRAEYEKCKALWESAQLKTLETPDIDREWERLSEKIRLNKAAQSNEKYHKLTAGWWQSILSGGLKPAFAAVMLIVIGAAALWFLQERSDQLKMTEIKTGNGIHRKVTLPDSSTVILNSGSSVKYTSPLGKNVREVVLTGEGFFSVKKGNRPFVVRTDNANVTVLGTKFNVWARDEKTKVIVKEGKVNLSDQKDGSKSVLLTESEASILSPGLSPTEPAKVNASKLLGWMDGKLVFYKSPLIEITGELERYYDIKFVLADDKLNNLTMTGSFKDEDPETLLSMICLALGVQYNKVNENEYVIIRKEQS